MPKRTSITYTDENYEYLNNFAYKSKNIGDVVNEIIEEYRTSKSILENFTLAMLDKVSGSLAERVDINAIANTLKEAANEIDRSASRLAIDTELSFNLEIQKIANWILYLLHFDKRDLIDETEYETQQALKQLLEEKKINYEGPGHYVLSSAGLERLQL